MTAEPADDDAAPPAGAAVLAVLLAPQPATTIAAAAPPAARSAGRDSFQDCDRMTCGPLTVAGTLRLRSHPAIAVVLFTSEGTPMVQPRLTDRPRAVQLAAPMSLDRPSADTRQG